MDVWAVGLGRGLCCRVSRCVCFAVKGRSVRVLYCVYVFYALLAGSHEKMGNRVNRNRGGGGGRCERKVQKVDAFFFCVVVLGARSSVLDYCMGLSHKVGFVAV